MDASPDRDRRRPLCRARLVILAGTAPSFRVLLAHHRHPDRSFWCFPGGAVEPGETFAQAALREAREETGLAVTLHGLCYAQDRPEADAVEWFFAASATGGAERLGTDPERRPGQSPVLDGLRWVELADLTSLDVLPRELGAALADGSYFTWGRLPLPGPARPGDRTEARPPARTRGRDGPGGDT